MEMHFRCSLFIHCTSSFLLYVYNTFYFYSPISTYARHQPDRLLKNPKNPRHFVCFQNVHYPVQKYTFSQISTLFIRLRTRTSIFKWKKMASRIWSTSKVGGKSHIFTNIHNLCMDDGSPQFFLQYRGLFIIQLLLETKTKQIKTHYKPQSRFPFQEKGIMWYHHSSALVKIFILLSWLSNHE
jgi:hypothetical protein